MSAKLQGSMESKKESVKQLLSELEKRNADQLNSGIGNDMSVTLAVPPSEVANTIHEMVTKSRPQGVVDRPAPVSSVSTIAEAFVPPPAPSREEEQEKQRQEEEEKQRREDEERRRREEEEERHEAERLRVDEQARAAAAEKERLAQEEQERQQQQQQQRQEAATTAAPAAPPAPADKEHRAEGSGHEIMLQVSGFPSTIDPIVPSSPTVYPHPSSDFKLAHVSCWQQSHDSRSGCSSHHMPQYQLSPRMVMSVIVWQRLPRCMESSRPCDDPRRAS